MLKYFPEKDKSIVQRVLREGISFTEPGEEIKKVIKYLSDSGIINITEKEVLYCTNENDDDFLDREDLDCDGVIPLDGSDLYCPVCGRPIENYFNKQKFSVVSISINYNGIAKYVKGSIGSLGNVTQVKKIKPFVFQAKLSNDSTCLIVIPPYADVRYLTRGLFFSEPTIYIVPAHINQEKRTILEERQFIELADLISEPKEDISERISLGATSIAERQDFQGLDMKFNQMFERHKGEEWQFFEQDFVPELVNFIAQNPANVQSYLARLKRLDQTIFGEFYVPIGGAGQTDLKSINKLSIMNQLLNGNKIGDAKRYTTTKLDYKGVGTINLHLDRDKDHDTAIVFVANDDIASTAWNTIMDLKENGRWKIIILTRYLILELISSIGASHLLDM